MRLASLAYAAHDADCILSFTVGRLGTQFAKYVSNCYANCLESEKGGKFMPEDIKPNKLNDRDRRRMGNIRDRLRSHNVGEDEATRRALEEVQQEVGSGKGGGHRAGGEPHKRKENEGEEEAD